MTAPTLDSDFLKRLREIREGFNLRWNPKAQLVAPGRYNGDGSLCQQPRYEGRWELWDVDPQGKEYMVMTLRGPEGEFRPASDWLLFHLNRMNPANYGGNVELMMRELVEEPEYLRELGLEKDSDDLFDAVGKWAEWCETPKSGAALSNRGQRLLST